MTKLQVQLRREELWNAMQRSIWAGDGGQLHGLLQALEAFIDAKIGEKGADDRCGQKNARSAAANSDPSSVLGNKCP